MNYIVGIALLVIIVIPGICLLIKWGGEFWQEYKQIKRQEEMERPNVDYTPLIGKNHFNKRI